MLNLLRDGSDLGSVTMPTDLRVLCFEMSDGKITAYSGPALLGGQRTYDAIHQAAQDKFE